MATKGELVTAFGNLVTKMDDVALRHRLTATVVSSSRTATTARVSLWRAKAADGF